MNLLIAIINIIIATTGLYFSAKHKRLGLIVWILITYFMLCFLPVATSEQLVHIQNYTNRSFKVSQESIRSTLLFVLSFNSIFLIFDTLFYKLHRSTAGNLVKSPIFRHADITQSIFVICLAYGAAFYYLSTRDFAYTDYVGNIASWPVVFLFCSASGICLAALRRNYLVAALMTIPFIYFMVHLKVRSFALLSAIPLVYILILQLAANGKSLFTSWKTYSIALPLFAVLLLGANYAMNTKQNKQRDTSFFPDSQMPFGCAIIIDGIKKTHRSSGFDGLILYANNISNPFKRLLGLHAPDIVDPPVIMAQIYEGFNRETQIKYHYPVLWYTDAYLAFGGLGLLLAIFWAAIFNLFEKVATHSAATLCVFLPAFCWHAYMVVRGATSGSTVPFLYSVYFSLIIFCMVDYKSIFRGLKSAESTGSAESEIAIKSTKLFNAV
jgi:hypothetical protein